MRAIHARELEDATFQAKIHNMIFEPIKVDASGEPSNASEVSEHKQKAIDDHLKRRQEEKLKEHRSNG